MALLQQHLSNVRSEVQQLATTWSNQMEEQGAACLPRVVRSLKEIEVLRGESESMSDLIGHLHDRVGNLEVETSASVRTLSELEVIKRRMDSCSSVLLQADRFKLLLQSMDEVYESGDVPRMSAALSSLVSSFSSLSNLAEFEGDKALIARYTERLEALVKPKMIKAFEMHDTPQSLACTATFRQIDRADQIALAYHKLFNQRVLSLWQSFDPPQPSAPIADAKSANPARSSTPTPTAQSTLPAPSTSSPSATSNKPSTPIESWISSFYNKLAALFESEVAWTPQIFPDAPTAIAKLLISALTQQNALMEAHLRKLDILRLTSVYTATKSFATAIDFLILPLGPGLRLQVFQALFASFRKFQAQYAVLESQFIDNGLGSTAEVVLRGADSATTLKALTTYSNSLFSLLHTATDHCVRFTEAVEAESLHRLATARLASLAQLANQTLHALRSSLLGKSAAPSTSSPFETIEWREESFIQAIAVTKVAAAWTNQLKRFSTHFRSQVLAQQSALFGEESLQHVIERQEQLTSNLFLYQPTEGVKSLAKLMQQLEDPSQDSFAHSAALIAEFASSAQFIAFESMFGFIRHQLNTMPKLPNFVRESGSGSPAAQGYIKQVVEHFLVLPQVMESMEHEGEETDEVTFLTLPVKPFAVAGRPKYFGLTPALVASSEEEISSSGFSGDWMEIIAKETQLLLASNILQLPQLTAYGVQQLDADILHLFSVLSVLGLSQDSLLDQILEYCRVPASEFSTILSETNDLERKKMLILLGRARRVLPANPSASK